MTLTPQMDTPGGTSSAGSTCTFTLSNASAFFVYGAMAQNARDDRFSVSVRPAAGSVNNGGGGGNAGRLLGFDSSWEDANEVLYWQSGLDRDATYEVVIKSEVAGKDSFFGFRSIDVWDAGTCVSPLTPFFVFVWFSDDLFPFSITPAKAALQPSASADSFNASPFAILFALFICIFSRFLR